MITKRYQVFISSTFADLKEERGKVQQAIMELDCIPAGMELFPALDEEQFEFIKRVIDDCDYYLLIIGGRYGSLSNEGVSYTEMEYKYAVEKGKKVIAFLHRDPESIPAGKSEMDAKARRKLAVFRDEASNNRLVRYWNEASELPGMTLSSLIQVIRLYPAIGWVRGDQVADPNLYKELAELRRENQELRESKAQHTEIPSAIHDLAELTDEIDLEGIATIYESPGATLGNIWHTTTNWGELLGFIGADLYLPLAEKYVMKKLAFKLVAYSEIAGANIQTADIRASDFDTVKIQFKALGFINLATVGAELMWSLTEFGERELLRIRAIKKKL